MPTRVALGVAGCALALAAALAGLLSGPGYRWGWWGFPAGFAVLRWAAYGGAAAAAVSLLALLRPAPGGGREGMVIAVAGLAAGLALFGWPLHLLQTARRLPVIHDISTDTDDPPPFSAILPLRAAAPNPAAYGGPEVAAAQHRAYPDIAPLTLPVPPGTAFDRALAVARRFGWEIVAADRGSGRIEASDRTFWYGFVDDVVVRVVPAPGGSRIDVRSVSRLGRSDVGKNASRIRRYLAAVAGES